MAEYYLPTANDVQILRELLLIVRRLGGPTQVNRYLESINTSEGGIGRITANAATETEDANENPVAWTYSIAVVGKNSAGYSASTTSKWTQLANVPVITGAFHFNEDANTGTGTQMTGVDHDGELITGTGYAMQPVPAGALVRFFFIQVTTTVRECWFYVLGNNGYDGTCTPP